MRTNYDGSNQNSFGGFEDDDIWDYKDDVSSDIDSDDMFDMGFSNSPAEDASGVDIDVDGIFGDGSRNKDADSIFEDDETSDDGFEEETLRGKLVNAYVTISIAMDNSDYPMVKAKVKPVVGSPYDVQEYKKARAVPYEDKYDAHPITDVAVQEVPKKTNKGLVIAVIIGALIMGAVGTVGTMKYINSRTVVSDSIEEATIEKEIKSLYKDVTKNDLRAGVTTRDVDSIRVKVESALSMDTDTDIDVDVFLDFLSEIETIELYISDKDKIEEYRGSGCSYEREDIDLGLSGIESDIQKYTVTGLKSSMNSLIAEYKSGRQDYFSLRDELLGFEDPLKYDEVVYLPRINAVTHTTDRGYLQQLSNKLAADKKSAELEKQYQEANDSDKERIKKELEEANSDKERLESELEEERKKQKDTSSSESKVESKTTSSEESKSEEPPVESKKEDPVESKEEEPVSEEDSTSSDEESENSSSVGFFDGLVSEAKGYIDSAKDYIEDNI